MKIFKAADNSLHALSDDDISRGGERYLPEGCIEISEAVASAIRAEQNQPTLQQLEAQFTVAIQQRLDDFARSRNYDSILSACTYATSTVAKFKSEGQACVNLRDATWSAAYDILAQVQAGTRLMPGSISDIETDLPPLAWPA